MTTDKAAISKIIEPIINELGYELIGCVYFSQKYRNVLRIYIDKLEGITLEDCQKVSRQVGAVLDVENILPGQYTLEVSSPGLDRPLFKLAHYQRFIGSKVRLRLYAPVDGKKTLIGILQEATVENISILTGEKAFTIAFENVRQANLEPVFD